MGMLGATSVSGIEGSRVVTSGIASFGTSLLACNVLSGQLTLTFLAGI